MFLQAPLFLQKNKCQQNFHYQSKVLVSLSLVLQSSFTTDQIHNHRVTINIFSDQRATQKYHSFTDIYQILTCARFLGIETIWLQIYLGSPHSLLTSCLSINTSLSLFSHCILVWNLERTHTHTHTWGGHPEQKKL